MASSASDGIALNQPQKRERVSAHPTASVIRPVPSGSKPDGRRLPPRDGRYTVVSADGRDYLYVPQAQQLFSLSSKVAQILRAAEGDPLRLATGEQLSDSSQAAYKFVSMLINETRAGALTERRSQFKGLRDVVIHVSQVCNMDCVYCYAVELNKANKLMAIETADRVIKQTIKLAPDGLSSVKFLGGEPTLAWPAIEHLMEGYIAASVAAGLKPPRFTMVTNGTRMTADMIESAARHSMYVLVSLDGPQEIHDKTRPYRNGRGTYKKASETLLALVKAGVNVGVESVYTRQHYVEGVTPQIMIDHFLSLGIREFHIPPAIGAWHGVDIFAELADVTQLYNDAVRGSIRSFRTSRPYLLRGMQFVMDSFAIRERTRHVCGAGRTFMGINYDGEAFPCYLLQSPDVSYGFVGDNWDYERYEKVRSRFAKNGKEYHPVCRECWANETCHSCLGTSWEIVPEVSKPPPWFCSFQKTLIATVLAEIAVARESADWSVFVKNWEDHLAPLIVTD